jgi:hypothetical protein
LWLWFNKKNKAGGVQGRGVFFLVGLDGGTWG